MKKDWYDKYGKEFHCADCTFLDSCLKKDEPLYSRCCEQYLRDRIAELEEQLRNAIVPKFNIGQEVWVVLDDGVAKDVVENNWFLCSLEKSRLGLYEDYLFATKEEAQAKLKELQGEIK